MKGRRILRKYGVQSPFKGFVKTTRYNKPGYSVRTLFKTPVLRKQALEEVTRIVRHECDILCKRVPTSSYFRSSSVASLKEFQWDRLIHDLHMKAPVLSTVLEAASASHTTHSPPKAMVGMAASVLLKARSKMMCKLQTLIGVLLYEGHAAKKVGVFIETLRLSDTLCLFCTYFLEKIEWYILT